MTFVQSRKIQLLTALIIIVAAAFWTYQDLELTVDTAEEPSSETEIIKEKIKAVPYLEKIENFALEEYTEDQLLAHFIEAETYYNFENSPILLLNIKVTTYDESGNEGFILSSNRANYLRSGEVFFNGEVSIQSKGGASHEIYTESLIVREKMKQIKSDRDVVYLGEGSKIHAQGMMMSVDDDTMELKGEIRIEQDSCAVIKTKNLYVDQSDGQKYYRTSEPTVYVSEGSTINAYKGMDLDMNKNYMQLLGKVEILQNSGSTIVSHDLIIDQSNGGEIYKSDHRTHYQSKATDIKAKSLYYDAKTQIIELTGGVTGVYE
jgi:LPS export ABC transporter protein LptC